MVIKADELGGDSGLGPDDGDGQCGLPDTHRLGAVFPHQSTAKAEFGAFSQRAKQRAKD